MKRSICLLRALSVCVTIAAAGASLPAGAQIVYSQTSLANSTGATTPGLFDQLGLLAGPSSQRKDFYEIFTNNTGQTIAIDKVTLYGQVNSPSTAVIVPVVAGVIDVFSVLVPDAAHPLATAAVPAGPAAGAGQIDVSFSPAVTMAPGSQLAFGVIAPLLSTVDATFYGTDTITDGLSSTSPQYWTGFYATSPSTGTFTAFAVGNHYLVIQAAPAQPFNWVAATTPASLSGRCCSGGATDAATGKVVIFGGMNGTCGGNQAYDDTWSWGGTAWTQESPPTSPPARASAGMAPNVTTGTVLLFGGLIPGVQPPPVFNDTWTWNEATGTWTQLFTAASPPARSLNPNAMVFDPSTQTVVIFGGQDGSGNALGDTWIWDGTTWTEQFPPVSPPARFNHGMAYDPNTGTVVLFGGHTAAGPAFDDTWTWDGTAKTWTQRFPFMSPPARENPSMTFDATTSSVVMFGGSAAPFGTVFYQDTWSWDGTWWAQLFPATVPSNRYAATMALDAISQSVLLFGGFSSGCQRDDTWLGTGVLPPMFTLTARVLAASGTVTGGGLSCTNNSGTCAGREVLGTPVTLTATPASGFSVASWSGCSPSSDLSTCVVQGTADTVVDVTFQAPPPPPPTTYSLIARVLAASGTVTGGGLSCTDNSGTCSALEAAGSSVTLKAQPKTGYSVKSWYGCKPSPTDINFCSVMVNSNTAVLISFGTP